MKCFHNYCVVDFSAPQDCSKGLFHLFERNKELRQYSSVHHIMCLALVMTPVRSVLYSSIAEQ